MIFLSIFRTFSPSSPVLSQSPAILSSNLDSNQILSNWTCWTIVQCRERKHFFVCFIFRVIDSLLRQTSLASAFSISLHMLHSLACLRAARYWRKRYDTALGNLCVCFVVQDSLIFCSISFFCIFIYVCHLMATVIPRCLHPVLRDAVQGQYAQSSVTQPYCVYFIS